jgi:hypothetical protein
LAGTAIPGSSITATLGSSSGANATGTVTFTVFGPQTTAPSNCSSGGTPVGTATVGGNNSYQPSTGYTPTTTGVYWWYASYNGDGNNQAASSTCGAGMTRTLVAQLQFLPCLPGTGALTVTCPTTGASTVTLRRANMGGGSWSASVTLSDSAGNPIVNSTGSAISVTITGVTSGAVITYSAGTSLTIPSGSSQSSNSFTYTNAGAASGKGSDTVTAAATGYTSGIAHVSW